MKDLCMHNPKVTLCSMCCRKAWRHKAVFLWRREIPLPSHLNSNSTLRWWFFFIPELRIRRINRRSLWYQQDGITVHTAKTLVVVLKSSHFQIWCRYMVASVTSLIHMWYFSLGMAQVLCTRIIQALLVSWNNQYGTNERTLYKRKRSSHARCNLSFVILCSNGFY